MTKRKDIIKDDRQHAKREGLPLRVIEGGGHTRIWVGEHYTTVPRHNEIPNNFAKTILKQIGIEK